MLQLTLIKLIMNFAEIVTIRVNTIFSAISTLIFGMLFEMRGISEKQSRFQYILKIYLQKEYLKFAWGNP